MHSRPPRIFAAAGMGLVLAAFCPIAGRAASGPKVIEGVVNLNVATVDELQLLPGVGPAKVRNIIAYRRKHPFRTTDELVRIKGIGRKMLRKLRPHLAVRGPTTARSLRLKPGEAAPVALPMPAPDPRPKPLAQPAVRLGPKGLRPPPRPAAVREIPRALANACTSAR